MSASKKYKQMDTTTELKDNSANFMQQKKSTTNDVSTNRFFCRPNSYTNNSSNSHFRDYGFGDAKNLHPNEKRPNFSMINHSIGDTPFLHKSVNNSSKPGDVKKIVIKNFKSKLEN